MTVARLQVGMNVMADLSDAEFAHDFLNPKMHEEFLASEVYPWPVA